MLVYLSSRVFKKRKVVGYDLNIKRIKELKSGYDKTFEINNGKFKKNKNLTLTNKVKNIKDCNCYILTVPTPINKKKQTRSLTIIKGNKNDWKYFKTKGYSHLRVYSLSWLY